ncbi:MAG: DsbA family protein, partial [Acidimicrobiales bacterium]|nr:DsbA family protein [Acidimicrobiales bacterium]
LMDAYFAENRTISDPNVLAEIAAQCGADPGSFISYVVKHQERLAQDVIDDHNASIEHGVTGVPTILLDEILPVQGAQDLDVYVQYIQRLIDRRHA